MALLQVIGNVTAEEKPSRSAKHDQRLWPIARPTAAATLSGIITDSFYSALLQSKAKVCFILNHGYKPPGEVLFSVDEPRKVARLVERLVPDEYFEAQSPHVKTDHNIHAHLRKHVPEGNLRLITPARVVDIVREHAAELHSLYNGGEVKFEDLNAVLSFLIKDGANIVGLPMLALANNSLKSFNGMNTVFATKVPHLDKRLVECLGLENFVHSNYTTDMLDKFVQDERLGIKYIDIASIVQLVEKRIPQQPKALLWGKEAVWFDSFVRLILEIGQRDFGGVCKTLAAFQGFPIVRLQMSGMHHNSEHGRGASYVSLSFCEDGPVLTDPEQRLRSIFSKIGIYIIDPDSPIRNYPESNRFGIQPDLTNFLCRLKGIDGYEISFRSLPDEDKTKMQEWIRDNFGRNVLSIDLVTVLSKLDIWCGQRREEEARFCSAQQVTTSAKQDNPLFPI